MENKTELKKVQENYERVKQGIAQKDYYFGVKSEALEWAKDYSKNNTSKYYYSHFFLYLKGIVIEQHLSRLEAFAIIGLLTELLNEEDYMNEDIDNKLFDTLYSTIYEEGSGYYSIPFSDDPPGEDPKRYAWSDKWRLWRKNE